MRTRRLFVLAALIALLGAGAGASACRRPAAPSGKPVATAASLPETAPPASVLATAEITNYRGKPLDKVSAEPETSIKGPQHVDINTYRLTVSGLVKTPLSLSYGQAVALPAYQKVTTLHCVDGWSVTYLWQGVLIKDLLQRAGYDPSARIVIFRCADGYSESLPLDFVVNDNILLAYKMNGVVMPPERGFPFQVVAQDRYGYKWAKWVTGIEVSNDVRFRGYYEKMGAENTATLPASR
jgi:DMSO/TMAO reductase YedYZ molybdopterin-dependent catalytic subunit